MSELEHLFGLGCLIIVGRAAPGLVVEIARRVAAGGVRARAVLRGPRSSSPTPDFSLEQTP